MRDNYERCRKKKCDVFGLSTDSMESHAKFAKHLKLPFDLLADPDKKAHRAYGVRWMQRTLVVVDRKGTVQWIVRRYRLGKGDWGALFDAVEEID